LLVVFNFRKCNLPLNLNLIKINIMTVNFQYVGVDVSETLSAFTEEKLKKMFNKYEFLICATVYFKQEDN